MFIYGNQNKAKGGIPFFCRKIELLENFHSISPFSHNIKLYRNYSINNKEI